MKGAIEMTQVYLFFSDANPSIKPSIKCDCCLNYRAEQFTEVLETESYGDLIICNKCKRNWFEFNESRKWERKPVVCLIEYVENHIC